MLVDVGKFALKQRQITITSFTSVDPNKINDIYKHHNNLESEIENMIQFIIHIS